MEAIIKTENQKIFQAAVMFLKSLNFEVLIKPATIKPQKQQVNSKKTTLPANNVLSKLVKMYSSKVKTGSINHDQELYGE